MFQAIREYFARPDNPRPRRGRGRRLVALFLFEFIVVVAGVLVAQMLQGAVGERRARAEASQAIERSRAEAVRLRLIADYWLKVGRCLEGRVDSIARGAALGRTADMKQIGRPGLPLPSNTSWSETTTLVARRAYGQSLVDQHAALVTIASVFRHEQDAIAHNWAAFALLDPEMGPPSAADRANVRLAATDVRASIRLLMVNGRFVRTLTDQMGIRPAPEERLDVTGVALSRVVDDCGTLRQWAAP